MCRLGQPQLHHRDQAVATGDDAAVVAELCQQADRLRQRRWSMVVERAGYQSSLLLCLSTSLSIDRPQRQARLHAVHGPCTNGALQRTNGVSRCCRERWPVGLRLGGVPMGGSLGKPPWRRSCASAP